LLTNLSIDGNQNPINIQTGGKELVKKKVKQLVCMAGKFPSGTEFNVNRDAVASHFVFTRWETPILFSGVEIGFQIRTGTAVDK